MAPKNGPPDRWMDYSPMGDRISGTRFICMKVPLKQGLSRKIEENSKFSCENAIEMVSRKGYKLGLVIDLSFTSRYYDPQSFKENDVAHKKIFMPGRVLPNKDVVDSFSESVMRFEDENKDNDDLIAVHCTHGLNRTGYMICRYLIDKKNVNPETAIKAFEEARGHKMEREIYLNDLLGKAHDTPVEKTQRQNSGPRNPENFRQDEYYYRTRKREPFHDNYQDSRIFNPQFCPPQNSDYHSWFDGGHYDGYDYRWQDYPGRDYHGNMGISSSYNRLNGWNYESPAKRSFYSNSHFQSQSEHPPQEYHREVRNGHTGRGERYRIHRESPYANGHSDFPNERLSARHMLGYQYW